MRDVFEDQLLAMLPRLRAQALVLTHNRAAAEDLVQDTVVSALGARNRFEPGTNFSAWTYTILRNRFITTFRKRREAVSVEDVAEAAFAVPGGQESRLVLQELGRALGRLSPEQREALFMVVERGMSYEAVAAAANCGVGTAKSRVFRARQHLKAMLLGEEGLPGHVVGCGRAASRNHPALHG